jgi:hypothetical protein
MPSVKYRQIGWEPGAYHRPRPQVIVGPGPPTRLVGPGAGPGPWLGLRNRGAEHAPLRPRRGRPVALRPAERRIDPKTDEPGPSHLAGHGAGTISACALVGALALAGVSGWFFITGLTAIFVGAPVAVMALGAAFEIGQLSAVSWLGRYGAVAS